MKKRNKKRSLSKRFIGGKIYGAYLTAATNWGSNHSKKYFYSLAFKKSEAEYHLQRIKLVEEGKISEIFPSRNEVKPGEVFVALSAEVNAAMYVLGTMLGVLAQLINKELKLGIDINEVNFSKVSHKIEEKFGSSFPELSHLLKKLKGTSHYLRAYNNYSKHHQAIYIDNAYEKFEKTEQGLKYSSKFFIKEFCYRGKKYTQQCAIEKVNQTYINIIGGIDCLLKELKSVKL